MYKYIYIYIISSLTLLSDGMSCGSVKMYLD